MKKIYLIHGWGGNTEESWFPWLKEMGKKKGFEVIIPEMPDTMNPTIEKWVRKIKEVIRNPDENTILIGHSIGCQAVMRYLEQLPKDVKIRRVIFVAGWFNLTDEVWDEEYTKEIANPWINHPIDFDEVKKHSNSFVAIASDDDPWVSLDDLKIFKQKLKAKTLVLKNKGHISGEFGVMELPEILNFVN